MRIGEASWNRTQTVRLKSPPPWFFYLGREGSKSIVTFRTRILKLSAANSRMHFGGEGLLNSYDYFSLIYDPAISWLYRKHRAYAAEALELAPGSRVLVPGCGTGLDFEFLSPAAGKEGRVIGIDFSKGMLKRAKRRVQQQEWTNVELKEGDARKLDTMEIPAFDRLLFFLTLSVLPDWEEIFRNAWRRLEPGGRCVVFDVHASRRVPQSWLVEAIARADTSRRTWEPLLGMAPDAQHERIAGSPHIHGGHLYFTAGQKK